MKDLTSREFWTTRIPLWRVVLIVLVLGTIPGAGSAVVLTQSIDAASQKADVVAQRQIREGCERTNRLRRLLNKRSAATEQLQAGLIDFMRQARRARMDPDRTTYDPKLADQYQRDISKVAEADAQELSVVDCDRAFHFTRGSGRTQPRATAALLP